MDQYPYLKFALGRKTLALRFEIDETMPNHIQIDKFKSLVAKPPKDQRPVACTITPNLANHILFDPGMVNLDQRKRNKKKVNQYAESIRVFHVLTEEYPAFLK